MKNILLISSLRDATGNNTTIRRIANFFIQNNQDSKNNENWVQVIKIYIYYIYFKDYFSRFK